MDLFDDYQDEVERLSDDHIEAILSGENHSSRLLTTLIRDVRLGLLEDPSPEIAARHLSAMARAAGPAENSWAAPSAAGLGRRHALSRRRLTPMVLVPALLLVAGLAAAVTLPKRAAQPARDTVPSTAPSVNPAAEDLPQEATHGQAVADVATDPSLTGCEKGQAVADVASAKAVENRKDPGEKNDPCARAGTQGKPKSGRRGVVPTGPSGSRGRNDSHPAGGAGPATAPGLGDEGPGLRGSEASGGRGGGLEVGGGGSSGGPGSGGGGNGSEVGGGGVPKDLPTP
jgi:hypothetical protein